eukprot:2259879-Prymnesium_polylepis.1
MFGMCAATVAAVSVCFVSPVVRLVVTLRHVGACWRRVARTQQRTCGCAQAQDRMFVWVCVSRVSPAPSPN